MATKLPKRGKNKLPPRGKKGKRRAAKQAADTRRFKFTKTKVQALKLAGKGQRVVYRDTQTPHLCLRVTSTAKTFFWEKTVRGSQKRVTIGRFPEINVEQARDQADDIAADYVKGIDVQEQRSAKRGEGTFGELWQDYRQRRKRRKEGKESKALDYQWKRYFNVDLHPKLTH